MTANVKFEGREYGHQFTRRFLMAAPVALVAFGVLQVLSSMTDPDLSARDHLVEDLTAQLVVGLGVTAVAFFVGRWAASRGSDIRARGVIGLAVGAVIIGPLVWWSAAPVLLAVSAAVLGNVTGTTSRQGGSGVARTFSLLAILIAVATVAVVVTSVISKLI